MINIPTNPMCNTGDDEAAQLVEKCVSWLSNDNAEKVQVMWHIYGGVKDTNNKNLKLARRKASCRDVALKIDKMFKEQNYYVYECYFSQAYNSYSTHPNFQTPIIQLFTLFNLIIGNMNEEQKKN